MAFVGGHPPVGSVSRVSSITADSSATVSWTTPEAYSQYRITPWIGSTAQTATTVSSGSTTTVTSNGITYTQATVSGLTNGTSYTFTVSGGDGSGHFAPESAPSGANTPQANLLFGDEFTGLVLDPSWTVFSRDGDQSNSELQYYLPAQVSLDGNSNLKIVINNTSITAPGYLDTNPPTYAGSNVTRSYRSGCIQWASFTMPGATAGKTSIIECAAVLPAGVGSGLWPLPLWMQGSAAQAATPLDPDNVGTTNWPTTGEVDVVEFGANGAGNLTSYDANYYQSGSSGSGDPTTVSCSNAHTNSHVYRFELTNTTLTWKLDGTAVKTTSISNYLSGASLFAIIQVAAAGTVTASFPDAMTVDYVHVFQQ